MPKPAMLEAIKRKANLFLPFVMYYWKRARLKYNFSATLGEQGSGKSYFSIFLGLTQDPFFDNSSIIYGPLNFMEKLDEFESRVWRGRVIVWDDAGVGLPASEWYSVSNKMIALIMQTVRTLHPSIIFTMPDMSYLDPKQRRVITTEFVCSLPQEKLTTVKIYTIKRLFLKGENITRRFRFSAGAAVVKLGDVRIKHADPDMLPDVFKDYEETQRRFKYETRKKLKHLLETGKSLSRVTDSLQDFSTITIKQMERELIVDTYKRFFASPHKFLDVKRKVDKEKIMAAFHVSSKIANFISKYWNKRYTPDMVAEDLGVKTEGIKNKKK